jgi:hypothetical protein
MVGMFANFIALLAPRVRSREVSRIMLSSVLQDLNAFHIVLLMIMSSGRDRFTPKYCTFSVLVVSEAGHSLLVHIIHLLQCRRKVGGL